jgi:hypothetical protein
MPLGRLSSQMLLAADELWPVRKATRYRDAFESKGCQIRRVQTAERQRTSGRSKLFSLAKIRRLMLVPHMGRALTGADGLG